MVKAQITREGTRIVCVELKGHSGYAKHGRDIVCSAISGIVQTALLGLKYVSTREVEYVMGESEGYLKFFVPEPSNREEGIRQEAILDTMVLGLRDIHRGYKSYLELEEL